MALLELHRVSKAYPGTQALHQINMELRAGEVHALIGENGAGKSTLIKLLSGVEQPDSGALLLDGQAIHFLSPQDAQQAGIRTLHQENSLLPDLTVAENVFLGTEPRRRWIPLIDWRTMRAQSSDLIQRLGAQISPDRYVDGLGIAEYRIVELAKVLHIPAKVLILDEPTAPLSATEVSALFKMIRVFKGQGIATLYITHQLDEVFEIADRVSILRDGQLIATLQTHECKRDHLIRLMSGRVNQPFTRQRQQFDSASPLLKVEQLGRSPVFENISFSLHSGEILGITGPIGSGKTALVRSIFGFTPATHGDIFLGGRPVQIRTPQDAIQLGIGFLPEDRREEALLPDMSALANISLTSLSQAGLLIDHEQEIALVERYIRLLRIKLPGIATQAQHLSGGTQQKLVLSRWLAVRSRILICDEATRGIDVNAKIEIHRILSDLARQGTAILLVSSEPSELVTLCDRIIVMKNGRQTALLAGDEITMAALAAY